MKRIIALAALFLAAPAPAQLQRDFSKVEIKVERIAPGVAVLFGSGGNIGLSHGEDGNIMIDDQFAPLTDRIVAAIATVDPDPVRFLINTHWHFDHTGGNENFGKMGAVILAHDNVRARMSTDQFLSFLNQTLPASPKAALPVVTFTDGVSLHLNGDTLHVIHVANAHTDGDSLIHWRKANVLHMGDTFFQHGNFPFIDLESGGSIDGVIAAVERALQIANAETKIIPGHGPVATRQKLVDYRKMLVEIRAKVAAGIKARRTLQQIQGSKPAEGYGLPNGNDFTATVYKSLGNPPKPKAPNPGT